ncbi:MAG: hypothetical protein AB1941_15850 [Gemmatimonadota bacterium]
MKPPFHTAALLAAVLLAACTPGSPRSLAIDEPAALSEVRRLLHRDGLIADPVVRDSMTARYAAARASGRSDTAAAAAFLPWLRAWAAAHRARADALRDSAPHQPRWTSPFAPPPVPDSILRRRADSLPSALAARRPPTASPPRPPQNPDSILRALRLRSHRSEPPGENASSRSIP